uniref:Uncharacterized protein n=1 Tax=Cyanoderma ruficeps TaxID=181631 RepID=A0A8C3RGK6_9PASS
MKAAPLCPLCQLAFPDTQLRGHALQALLAPQTIEEPENNEGLKLCCSPYEFNRASKDVYSNQVVWIISTKGQIMTGVKYSTEAEIAPQSGHTICNFSVLNVPRQNQVDLLESKVQAVNNPKSTQLGCI